MATLKVWEKINCVVLKKLIKLMPKRMIEMIKLGGEIKTVKFSWSL